MSIIKLKAIAAAVVLSIVALAGCITKAGGIHSECIEDREPFRSLQGQQTILLRPVAVVFGKHDHDTQDIVETFDDRPSSVRALQPIPSSLPTGTKIKLESFYLDTKYAATIWPLFVDLFPSPPTYWRRSPRRRRLGERMQPSPMFSLTNRVCGQCRGNQAMHRQSEAG